MAAPAQVPTNGSKCLATPSPAWWLGGLSGLLPLSGGRRLVGSLWGVCGDMILGGVSLDLISVEDGD